MSTEANKALIRRYRDIHNRDHLDALDEIVAKDLVSHNGLPGLPPGLEGGKMAHQFFQQAFETTVTTDDLVAEGDKVVERFTAHIKHVGPFMGFPATGKSCTTTGMSIFRIANDQIVEHWGENDALGLMQQLGMIPGQGQS